MKLVSVLLISPVCVLVATSPSFAQGISATTVTNFIVSPTGRQQTNIRVVTSEQGNENGFTYSSDVRRESNTNRAPSGAVTNSTVGSVGTSFTREQGEFSRDEVVDFSESFEFVDFVFNNTVTTGASGERGPRRR